MNPSYIFWGLSALFVAMAVWIWRMSEKEWLRRCFALAPIAFWPIMLLCCKKSKYKKTYKK